MRAPAGTRPLLRLVVVSPVLAASLLASAVAGSPAATPACAKTQVAKTVGGARSCVAATPVRVRPAGESPAVTFLAVATTPLPAPAWRGTKPYRPPLSAAVARRLVRGFAVTEGRAVTLVEKAVGAAIEKRRRPAHRSRAAADGITVTQNADGSVTGRGTQTTSSGGTEVTQTVGVTGKPDGTLEAEAGFEVKLADGSRLSARLTFGAGDGIGSCPSPAGTIAGGGSVAGSFTSDATKDGLRTTQTVSVSMKQRVDSALDGDAVLQPVRFSTTVTLDHARTLRQGPLRFVTRLVGRGTYSGTIEPRTGAVSGGVMTITTTASGFLDNAAARASGDAAVKDVLEGNARSLLDSVRRVEASARGGECTRLEFTPASPGELAPGATESVRVGLVARGLVPEDVPTVKWRATPEKGKATPETAQGKRLELSVTGASRGPETARVRVKATSPAGISEGTWVGQEGDLPRTYSGTVSATSDIGNGGITDRWSGTVTYTRESVQENADGSRRARYTLTVARVESWSGTLGGCTATGDPGGTIKFGDLELEIGADGTWKGAFVVDVELAPTVYKCPPPAPSPPTKPKAFLNSRTAANALRPMQPRGPLTATNLSDLAGTGLPGQKRTASWNLTPSGK